jgi:hypothetical protein
MHPVSYFSFAAELTGPSLPALIKTRYRITGKRLPLCSAQADKALQLSHVGFTNVEIGNLLQTTQGVIGQQYTTRKKEEGQVDACRARVYKLLLPDLPN